ncbi:hypothetical protein N0V83_004134 [Neocucurbitaria cava]|uniref:Uncharacterized protein n=1 Tax=Neocucurbitaria cava TaxID=798079 RepID=A0A9W8YAZ6_9PLEO|nr:hypothetical protein N0V83_004134 [Neocucurbitaria cava]
MADDILANLPATDELPSYDSLLRNLNNEELPGVEEKVEDSIEDLMRPVWKDPAQQLRNDTAADLSDGNENFLNRSTGIDRTPDGLIQRRPWKGIAHQDVPVLAPAIKRTRITYRTLKSTAEVWLFNRAINYAVFIALILGSAATAGLAVWKATIESSSNPSEPAIVYGDDFYGSVSQGLGSVLGVFCMVIPLIERNRQLQPEIPVRCPRTFR